MTAGKLGVLLFSRLSSLCLLIAHVVIVVTFASAYLGWFQVNCETDFVARNNKFISLVTQASQDCHNALLQQPGMVSFILETCYLII